MDKPTMETEPVMLTQAIAELIKAAALMAGVLSIDIPNESVEAAIKLSGAIVTVVFLGSGLVQGLFIRNKVFSPAKVKALVTDAKTGEAIHVTGDATVIEK